LALQLYPTKYQYNRKDDVRIFTFNSKNTPGIISKRIQIGLVLHKILHLYKLSELELSRGHCNRK